MNILANKRKILSGTGLILFGVIIGLLLQAPLSSAQESVIHNKCQSIVKNLGAGKTDSVYATFSKEAKAAQTQAEFAKSMSTLKSPTAIKITKTDMTVLQSEGGGVICTVAVDNLPPTSAGVTSGVINVEAQKQGYVQSFVDGGWQVRSIRAY